MSDVSEDSLLDYFYTAGAHTGKVKNADILKTYKPFIGHSDLQLRAKYREEFKLVMDRIAVVKSENGEKYLVLKKKYRQVLQERHPETQVTDREGRGFSSPPRSPATAQRETREDPPPASASAWGRQGDPPPASGPQDGRPARALGCGGPYITVSGAPGRTHSWEDQPSEETSMEQVLKEALTIQTEDPGVHSSGDEDQDKDSGSKSESEQDEEGRDSMDSAPVALDPIEKEWIYSAACARVTDLSQLLRQDSSLANKKDFTSGFTALHWAAKHGKEDMATLVAEAGADVNTRSHGGYTPLHIAALHGHQHILSLLVGTYGAKETLRDYSGHLACHYLSPRDPEVPEEDNSSELQFQVAQVRERNRNRKLSSLFHSKKKWGSAEDLAPIEEERSAPHQLLPPAFRPRKFSR